MIFKRKKWRKVKELFSLCSPSHIITPGILNYVPLRFRQQYSVTLRGGEKKRWKIVKWNNWTPCICNKLLAFFAGHSSSEMLELPVPLSLSKITECWITELGWSCTISSMTWNSSFLSFLFLWFVCAFFVFLTKVLSKGRVFSPRFSENHVVA